MSKQRKNTSIPPGRTTPVPKRPDRDRRVRQSERMARILRVLTLIQSRGRWRLKDIAEELECSERTVRRDLEALSFAGVPWFVEEDGSYIRVRSDFRFPVLMLTEEEVLGQALATALSQAPGLNISVGAKPTTRKLASVSNDLTQEMLSDAAQLIEVLDLKLADHSQHYEAIKTVQFALLQRKQITGFYESPSETSPVKLKLHPYRLCLTKQAWYIIGRPDDSNCPHTYRVTRFKTLQMINKSAEIPEEFDLREYFGNAWGAFRGEKTYEVEIEFSKDAAPLVRETIWHHTQQVKQYRNGKVRLQFKVDGLYEIVHWVLSWSGRAKVIRPLELREILIKNLQQALEMNNESK